MVKNKIFHKIFAIAVLIPLLCLSVSGEQGEYNFIRLWPEGPAFSVPTDLDLDASGNIYVIDRRILKLDPNGNFLASWGAEGSRDGEFQSPHGIALDNLGNIYVADYLNHCVKKFDSNGNFLTKWGTFSFPRGIAVDTSGDVYVADRNNRYVQKFDSDGNFLAELTGFAYQSPNGVATDASGNVYVTDTNANRVRKFDPNGTPLTDWAASMPGDIAIDGSGTVYVVDWHNDRIQKFGSNGSFLKEWDVPGGIGISFGISVDTSGNVYVTKAFDHLVLKFDPDGNLLAEWDSIIGSSDGYFNWPDSAVVDVTGNVFVADSENHRIQKFDSNGNFLAKWGTQGSDDGQFNWPKGVALDVFGNVYVVDDGCVQKFDPNGIFLKKWTQGGSGIAVDLSGNVYIADYGSECIWKIDSNGNVIKELGDGLFSSPDDVAVDLLGNFYVADTGNSCIQKFDSNGNYLTKWGTEGSDNGQFMYPVGVEADIWGNVYVADSRNNRIQKFDSNGNFVAKWGVGQFLYPRSVSIDLTGNAYTADTGNSCIKVYGSTGNFPVSTHTLTATANSEGEISPSGIITVYHGTDQPFTITFTITPLQEYCVDNVIVDSASVGAVTAYTFANTMSNHTIHATFIDCTPPITPVVTDDGNYTTSQTQLHALWISSDGQSGISECQYAIGTTVGGTDMVEWTSTGTDMEVTAMGISLSHGQTYYFSVKAKNGVGLWSEVGFSDGIKVDLTPPTIPVVIDDGAYTLSKTQLHASWTSNDSESGLSEYQYAIGTTAAGTDVVGWISTGTWSEVTATELNLSDEQTYYFSVKARNGVGFWSDVGVSDGIKVDSTKPTTPRVTDDGDYTNSANQLHAWWTSNDTESGIAEYQYAIGTIPGATDIIGWTSAGIDTEVIVGELDLVDGQTYYFSVKSMNNVGLWSDIGISNGITVDISLARFELYLPLGWNLISLPLDPASPDPDAVLSSLGDKYDSIWAYDPALGWSVYASGAPGNLQEIVSGKGYWIKMNYSETLVVHGTFPESTAVLLKGAKWNLAGYCSLEFKDVEDCNLPDCINSVWEYSANTGWSIYAPGWITNLETMKFGFGYWIKVEADHPGDCVWDVE